MASIDRSQCHATYYRFSITTMALSCIVVEIKRYISRKTRLATLSNSDSVHMCPLIVSYVCMPVTKRVRMVRTNPSPQSLWPGLQIAIAINEKMQSRAVNRFTVLNIFNFVFRKLPRKILYIIVHACSITRWHWAGREAGLSTATRRGTCNLASESRRSAITRSEVAYINVDMHQLQYMPNYCVAA